MPVRKLLRILFPLFGVTFTLWMFWGYQSVDVPDSAMHSDSAVRVFDNGTAAFFQPRHARRATGVIFLPGGMVDPVAYAPFVKSIAASGHPAYLLRLPLRCACTDHLRNELFAGISELVRANPDTRWFLAGHSRGAMLAARYSRESATNIGGLILIGTTHPRDFDLSGTPLKVTRILGSNDGVAPVAAARANTHLLPPSTETIEIPGANHVQFAHYRHQLLDGAATITREFQQAETLKAVRRALE